MTSTQLTAAPAVLLAANSSWNANSLAGALVAALLSEGYRPIAAVPEDGEGADLRAAGIEVHHTPIDARGLSPLRDGRLLLRYRAILGRTRPIALLPFTAKPNIYGSIAAAATGVPVINTITGLGTGFLSGAALRTVMSTLYRIALRRSYRVFFHNSQDRDLFIARKIVAAGQTHVVGGSGVDLNRFVPSRCDTIERQLTFLFIGRVLRDKGALEFLDAAELVSTNRTARFRMLGTIGDHPKAIEARRLQEARKRGTVELLGQVQDVRPFIAEADCIVLPSYREGLPRVILEASAMAKPVIVTDVPGCRQAVDDRQTGLLCQARSASSLADAMRAMADMPSEKRQRMGRRGRQKMEHEFSQEKVVGAYLDALRELRR